MTIIIVIVDKITRSVYYYFIKNKSVNFANTDYNYIKLYCLLPSDIIISFCPKSGDSPHRVPCQNSDFVSESMPGPKYICLISIGLLRTRHIISLIESWYESFEPREVDGVFFDEILIGFVIIGSKGRRFLQDWNLLIFFTT